MNYDTRNLDIELRASIKGDKKTVEGYASVFNKKSGNLGFFREIIAPGAFTRALKTADNVIMLHDHKTENLLASTKSGTLNLTEDMRGLRFEAELPNTSRGDEVFELVRSGVLSGMSFGFTVKTDKWETIDGEEIRTVKEVDELFEISTTGFPAYPDTSLAKRSLEQRNTSNGANLDAFKSQLEKMNNEKY